MRNILVKLEEKFEKTSWDRIEFTETTKGFEYFIETWSDAGEDLIVEGEADSLLDFAKALDAYYVDADSDETFNLFWQMKGERGYPYGRDAIDEALELRKAKYEELVKVFNTFDFDTLNVVGQTSKLSGEFSHSVSIEDAYGNYYIKTVFGCCCNKSAAIEAINYFLEINPFIVLEEFWVEDYLCECEDSEEREGNDKDEIND